jgi:glutathione S-transferase
MEIASHAYLLSAAVTILAIFLYLYIGYVVGAARGKYDIKAPAVTGHPGFERAYRVQLNTVEQFPIFLPALWLATIYFTRLGWLPAAIGLVWVIGRFLYLQGYIADPAKRSLGFLISFAADVVLIALAIAGIVMAWSVT